MLLGLFPPQIPFFLLGLCLLVFPNPIHAEWAVALKPDKNPEAMLAERQSLENFLEQTTGESARVITPLSSAVIQEGLENGSLDAAFLSAADMSLARSRGQAEILLAVEIVGQTSYPSYWVTLTDKEFTSIEDLKDHPVAFASRTSMSGFVVPYRDLVQRHLLKPGENPENFFGRGQVFFGTGYVSAVERVLRGEAEAAAVSYYVLDEDKHLSASDRQRLSVLQSQGPVPTHVIAVRSSLDPAKKTALRTALLQLNAPAHLSLRDQLFTSKLVEVDEAAHLAPIAEALAWVKAIK